MPESGRAGGVVPVDVTERPDTVGWRAPCTCIYIHHKPHGEHHCDRCVCRRHHWRKVGIYDVPRRSIRHPKRLWLHRLLALGRTRRTIESGVAVEWYVSRHNTVVVLSSFYYGYGFDIRVLDADV